MKKTLALIAIVFLLGSMTGAGRSVLAALGDISFTPSLIPTIDSSFDVGTSTKAYREGWFDELCLTADTCRTSWPAGGGGGGTANSKWATSSPSTDITPNSATGVVMTRSTTTSATTTNFFSTTASSTNLFSTNANLGLIVSGNGTSTNWFSGTASSTNLFSTSLYTGNATGTGQMNLFRLLVTSSTTLQNATSSNFFTGTASSTNLFSTFFYGGSLKTCTGGNVLTWSAGSFGCATDATGGGGANSKWATSTGSDITPNGSGGILVYSSSTISALTVTNGTTTNATSTNLFSTLASTTRLFGSSLNFDNNTLVVDSTNHRVGVGLSNPSEKLHISGPTGSFTTVRIDSGTTQGYFWCYDGDTSCNVGSNSNATVNFKQNNTTRGSIDTNGLFTFNNGFLSLASSTLQNFTGVNSTTTNSTSTTHAFTTATSTNLWISNLFRMATNTPVSSLGWGATFGTTTVVGPGQLVNLIASSTSATTLTIDWSQSTTQTVNLVGTTNLVINATSSKPIPGGKYSLRLCQDNTGSRTVNFVTANVLFRWSNDATTTITTTAKRCTWIGMIYEGSTYNVIASSTNIRRD